MIDSQPLDPIRAAWPEFKYREDPLDPLGNLDCSEVMDATLYENGLPLFRQFDLEPGDMTRYTLVTCRMATGTLVMRLIGGSPHAALVIPEGDRLTSATILANGNPHTDRLLTWWINGFLLLVGPAK